MPRIYRVFISSPFKGLEEARKAAILGVSDCGHIPVALENFAPADESDLEIIYRTIDASQIYLAIVGPRYGQSKRPGGPSYTELEFKYAERKHKRMVVFALDQEEITSYREKLKRRDQRDRVELSSEERRQRFYKKVTKGKHFYGVWRMADTEALRRNTIRALEQIQHADDAPRGLILEPADPGQYLVVRSAGNQFIQQLIRSITSFEKLYERTDKNADLKECASSFFASRFGGTIQSSATKGVFFESGSSIAFMARAVSDWLRPSVSLTVAGNPTKRITTNNILAFMHLWLERGIPCSPFPWGPPEGTYGASYGPIEKLPDRPPEYAGMAIDEDARKVLSRLRASPHALSRKNTSVIFAATSGLQLSRGHEIESDVGYRPPPRVQKTVEHCFGPHVGSYKNKVFKRYLYETGVPVVLVIDSLKIDCRIDVRHCHFVFGRGFSWQKFIRNKPFALCVGCPSSDLDRLTRLVEGTMPGFTIDSTEPTGRQSAFIASNRAFERAFPR